MKFANSIITNFYKYNIISFFRSDLVFTTRRIHEVNLALYYEYLMSVTTVRFYNSFTLNLVTRVKPQNSLAGFLENVYVRESNPSLLVKIPEEVANKQQALMTNTNLNSSDFYFLRKEKIYAKLKYSRSPQYDIVSGGLAAILSGFLGFLICEKFGLELLDSGDFYIAFMYGVFATFSIRPLLRSVSGFKKDGTYVATYNVISVQHFFEFYRTLTTLMFSIFKK